MKLNAAQILWLIATAALLGTVVADIVGIAQVPPAYWMFGFGALAIVGWWIMPSLSQLRSAHRRRSRFT